MQANTHELKSSQKEDLDLDSLDNYSEMELSVGLMLSGIQVFEEAL